MLSLAAVAVVTAGAFAGGFISGLAGFGTGLVALGIWLHVIAPAPATTLAAVCSVAAQAQTIPAIWHAIDRRRVWPMLAAGLVGVPLGTALLPMVDPDAFRLSVGLLLIAFASFMLLGRWQPHVLWGGRVADSVVGFAGGFLGGLCSLSGPIPTVWATLRGWSKDERRSLFQIFNLTILATVVIWHVVSGLVTWEFVRLVLTALPGTVVGAWLGVRAYQRLSDHQFQRVVLGLLALSGVSLVWSSV